MPSIRDYQFPVLEDREPTDLERDVTFRISEQADRPCREPMPEEFIERWQHAAAEVAAYGNWLWRTSELLHTLRHFPVSTGDGWQWVLQEKRRLLADLEASCRTAQEHHSKARAELESIIKEKHQYHENH